MIRQERVSVYLGEKREREFSAIVEANYVSGDYYNEEEVDYMVFDLWDEDNCCPADNLIKKYENINKVDFDQLAIQEFINEY